MKKNSKKCNIRPNLAMLSNAKKAGLIQPEHILL